MDAIRVGRSIRALRIQRGWRQRDLAAVARISRATVSRLEAGELHGATFEKADLVCTALGAHLDVRVRWHGEALERLLDEAHAGIVDRVVRLLREAGWEAAVEVTFNVYGDRGSVDVVGWHIGTRTILICEIKSVIADAQGTLAPLDRKARLAVQIGRLRGWEANVVAKALIVRDGSTTRSRVAALRATFDATLPMRAVEFRRWLASPNRPVAALLFLPDVPQKSLRRRRTGLQRVNRPRSRVTASQ